MASGTDLAGLIRFSRRGGWAKGLDQAVSDHLGMALGTLDLEDDDVSRLLGEHWGATLWGCAFEDFLTRRLPPDGRNVVEAYLKRHGGEESAEARAYIEALRFSVFSLYEVGDIMLGQSFRARDLILGGEPVLVHEKSATEGLTPGDKIAARLVRIGARTGISGGLLPFGEKAAALLLAGLLQARQSKGEAQAVAPIALDAQTLQRAAPLLTTVWLLDRLPHAIGGMPDLLNADGEVPVFHQFHYPIIKGVRQSDLAERLATIPALSPVRARIWDWLEDGVRLPDEDGPPTEAISVDGRIILGHVELRGRVLVLTTNSVSRAERATAMIERALGERLHAPTVRIETLDEPDA